MKGLNRLIKTIQEKSEKDALSDSSNNSSSFQGSQKIFPPQIIAS